MSNTTKEAEAARSICAVSSLKREGATPHSCSMRWKADCWMFSSWRATSMLH